MVNSRYAILKNQQVILTDDFNFWLNWMSENKKNNLIATAKVIRKNLKPLVIETRFLGMEQKPESGLFFETKVSNFNHIPTYYWFTTFQNALNGHKKLFKSAIWMIKKSERKSQFKLAYFLLFFKF